MKRIFISFICVLLLACPVLAREQEEFGLRVNTGFDRAGYETNYEMGLNIDFIFWQNFYFLMGANFLFPENGTIQVAMNSLGLEYDLPVGGADNIILGAIFNRSYIKGTNGQGHKEWSFHAGYKHRWFDRWDWVTYVGVIPEALLKTDPVYQPGSAYFLRTGVEVYY